MKLNPHRCARPALDLLDEAVHLLRLSPGSVIATYYLGSLPFVIAFLFFWADMSQSAFAPERISSSAFVLGILFLWMKLWQMIYARQLFGRISGQVPERWTWSTHIRAAIGQTILQPSGLFLLVIAVVVTLPFGWVYAFYQNVTVLGGIEPDLKNIRREAVRQAQVWPAQNHALLAFLSVGALVVFLNLAIACFMIPQLLKMLFGIETVFTRHPFGMLNSTLLMAVTGLTYLCLDPLVKAVYVLRCFYGRAIKSGEDLKAELRSLPAWQEHNPMNQVTRSLQANIAARKRTANDRAGESGIRQSGSGGALILGLMVFALVLSRPARIAAAAQEAAPVGEPASSRQSSSVTAAKLDQAVDSVLSRPEFSWRMPRAKVERGEESGWLVSFVRSAFEMVGDWMRTAARWGKKLFDWLEEKLFNKFRSPLPKADGGTGWMTSLHLLLYILIALVAALLAVMALRIWRRRRGPADDVYATAIPTTPDLTDENILADELPEQGWLRLGRELMERGELRLALRAFYLAGLAHLGQRELIRIERFKSNRDYESELARRARSKSEITDAFSQTVRLFDRVWYGRDEITATDLEQFQLTLKRIIAC